MNRAAGSTTGRGGSCVTSSGRCNKRSRARLLEISPPETVFTRSKTFLLGVADSFPACSHKCSC